MKTIALIGNPNVGKTLIFNALTGATAHVGNWPGVTVEKKEGYLKWKGERFHIIDLPGTYGLDSDALDEKIARDFIIDEKPDLIVDIVDASNLERNLYLTSILLELGCDVILALNKMDATQDSIDVKKLSKLLGVPVVPLSAAKDVGIDDLKDMIAGNPEIHPVSYGYGKLEKTIAGLEKLVSTEDSEIPARWIAIRALEGDARILEKPVGAAFMKKLNQVQSENPDIELSIADSRYSNISKIISKTVRKKPKTDSFTALLDKIFLNRFLSVPIFLFLMWLTFHFAFTLSEPVMGLMELFFENLGIYISGFIEDPWLESLLVDGIIGGWGFVLVFVPPIMFLFLALSFLEDSGYLARAAFVMEKFMNRLGLHGRATIPMIMALGCNVPAIMSSRSIEDENDRMTTILVNPLISCSARLPVYVLLAGVFFPESAGLVVFSLYLLGIILALTVALLLRKFVFRGTPKPFILELPDYQLPTFKSTIVHMWNNVYEFLSRAATILFVGSIIVWFLITHPWGSGLETSYAGYIGKSLEAVTSPLGFTWKTNVALLSGALAKEIVVGTFGIIYSIDGATTEAGLLHDMTPLTAYAFLAFVLLYLPCIPAITVIRKETGSWKWALFSVCYQLLLAYSVAYIIVNLG